MVLFKMFVRLRLLLLVGVIFPQLAWADGSEVAVVYNAALPESKAVAEHYAQARQVPKSQIFSFSLPTGLEISRADFNFDLQQPLADALETNGLWKFGEVVVPYNHGVPKHTDHRVVASRIRYLVLCYGVPVRIQEDPTLQEYDEAHWPPSYRVNTASVDSELAWLPTLKMRPLLYGPMANQFYGATNEALLSPTNGILLVARLDGPSPAIASGLVDKAMAAERDGLWGRGYFDLRGLAKPDPYFYGDELILSAAETCYRLGYDTSVDTNSATFPASYPLSHIAIYCGWYDWNASGPFALPQVEFMPGAFAYHLHSFSAADVRSYTNNWVGPLLAKGATCTMGCVSEPLLNLTPNVAEFLRDFARGWSFGEAAWAAQPALSWQTTVVGDPLYRPFAVPPLQRQHQLQKEHSPWLEWSYLRLINLDLAHGAPVNRITGALSQLDLTGRSAVLSEKLADLYAAVGKPSSAIDYWQQALKLNPSPEQRIRLRLALGASLTAQNQMAAAAEDYRQLLAEAPDYSGKTDVQQKLKQLAQSPYASVKR